MRVSASVVGKGEPLGVEMSETAVLPNWSCRKARTASSRPWGLPLRGEGSSVSMVLDGDEAECDGEAECE